MSHISSMVNHHVCFLSLFSWESFPPRHTLPSYLSLARSSSWKIVTVLVWVVGVNSSQNTENTHSDAGNYIGLPYSQTQKVAKSAGHHGLDFKTISNHCTVLLQQEFHLVFEIHRLDVSLCFSLCLLSVSCSSHVPHTARLARPCHPVLALPPISSSRSSSKAGTRTCAALWPLLAPPQAPASTACPTAQPLPTEATSRWERKSNNRRLIVKNCVV